MNPPAPGFDLTRENPWPGLQSFTEDGRGFFFGRDEETEALLRLVRRERLTVFYGQSGLGKSSLLRAGLFPKLRSLNFLPVPVRLDYAEKAPAPGEQLKQALGEAFRSHQIEARAIGPEESLWAYFHRDDLDFWDSRNRIITPVLVFDQFEERFTLGRLNEAQNARAEEFLSELSQLVENRPPPVLRDHFETDPEAALAYNFDKQTCKVVLSLREDFLPELDGLRERFPSLANNQFRLLPMTREQALKVAHQPDSRLMNPEVASAIVDFVAYSHRQGESGEVEPALLSLILQELNALRIKRGDAQISADLHAGNKDKILERFYEEAVKDLPEEARKFVEFGLLTGSGYRDSVVLEKARSEFGLDDASLAALVNRHLVRREERLGSTRLELVHDLLTKVIMQSRRQRQELERLKALSEQEWRQKNDKAVKAALRINGIAAEWGANGKREDALLLRGVFLSQATELLDEHPGLLSPEAGSLIEASQKKRRKWRMLLAALGLVTLGFVSLGSFADKNLSEFALAVWFTVIPCALVVADKFPGRLQPRTLARSAWRWSLYGWVASLIICYQLLDPDDAGSYFGVAILSGFFFLIPFFKWKTHREAIRLALRPVPRLRSRVKIPVLIVALLGLAIVIAYKTVPGSFSKITRKTEALVNAAASVPDFSSYVEAATKRTIVRQRITKKDGQLEVVEDSYFVPGEVAGGYQKSVVKKDKRGNEVERAYFDLNGKPAIDRPDSYHMCQEAYDERGNETNLAYLDIDGRLTLCTNGYASLRKEFDADDHWTLWAYYDRQGHLTWPKNDVPEATRKFDKHGHRIELANFGTNGEPILDSDSGYHLMRTSYDERGNWTNEAYLGVGGRPTLLTNGYASATAKWDKRGNLTEWACFGLNGEPVIDPAVGYHMWRESFDGGTNWTSLAFYDCLGRLTQPINDVPKGIRKLDKNGRQVEWACFGTNGEPILIPGQGYHMARTVWDERGHWTNEVYLGIRGQPIINTSGYASQIAKWDDRGNQTEWAYFGTNGEPILCGDGYQHRIVEYDADGKIASDQRYDVHGKLLRQAVSPTAPANKL